MSSTLLHEPGTISIKKNLSPQQSGISSNRIHGAIRLKGEKNGPLHPARSLDSAALEKISRAISQKITSTRQLLLTTGFGIHQSCQIPVRLPALLLPGLQMMELLHDANLPVPTYLVYQATDFIAETNKLNSDESKECSEKMALYLQRYVDRFHERIKEKVLIRFKCPYTPDTRDAISKTVEVIRERASAVDDIKKVLLTLEEYGRKQTNDGNTFEVYAAANAVYSGAIGKYPFGTDLPMNTEAILPIGGRKEEPFFKITSEIADASNPKVIPLLTPLGKRPTYYPYIDGGDPLSVADYQKSQKNPLKDASLRLDLAALVADGATPEALSDIYPL